MSAQTADKNLLNGQGNVPPADNGIHLWKKWYARKPPVAKHVAHGIESVRSKPQRLTEIESNEEQRIDMLDEEPEPCIGRGDWCKVHSP